MKTCLTIAIALVLGLYGHAQPNSFTNYYEIEKKLEIIDFGYEVDSTQSISIPRSELPNVYTYIEG